MNEDVIILCVLGTGAIACIIGLMKGISGMVLTFVKGGEIE